MRPCYRVRPLTAVDAERAACDAAFAKACRYSSGRDIVEEMVLSEFWPLGKYRPEMTLVKMKLLVFGSEDGEYVPCFKLRRAEDETDEEFVEAVEKSATLLLGDISEKEYLSRRAIGERKVPEKVLRSVEAKAAKAASTAVAL